MNLHHLTDTELLELRAAIDKLLQKRQEPSATTRVKLRRPTSGALPFVRLLRAATQRSLVDCAEAIDRGDIVDVPNDFLLDICRFLGDECIQG